MVERGVKFMSVVALLVHFIADFIFQSDKTIKLKETNMIRGNLRHVIGIYTCYLVAFIWLSITQDIDVWNLVILATIITSTHFMIDLIKSIVLNFRHNREKHDLIIFILDQIIHVISIVLLVSMWNFNIPSRAIGEYSIILIYVFVIFFGDYLIRKVLKASKMKSYANKETDIKGIGSQIGKIERFILLTLLIFGYPQLVIAVMGIKSIARFPELSNKSGEESNDYFILGNLLSLLIVIIGFVVFKSLYIDIF